MGPTQQLAALGALGLALICVVLWLQAREITSIGMFAGTGAYIIAVVVALGAMQRSYPHPSIGFCNSVTLLRLVLTTLLVAWLFAPSLSPWLVFGVGLTVLTLDGLDGWLARHEGYVSDFGARFDMEVDSVLALVLALHVYQSGHVGAFVLVLGAPRYVFFAAQFVWPWLTGTLPPRFSRKLVCVLQITVLVFGLLPIVPTWLTTAAVIVVSAALIWSFALDIRHLSRHRS